LDQQLFAKRHADRRRKVFQAGQQSPSLALDLSVEPTAQLLPAYAQRHLVPVEKLILLVGVQSPGHASPQDQPFDLALKLSWKRQSGHVDLARLRDSPIVGRRAEARSQAEAEEVEPAGFVFRPLLPAIRHLRQRVAELANR